MFGKSVTLFKLFGFSVKVDASWLLLAVLLSWTLARGVFPSWVEGLSTSTYWIMGIGGTIGLFFSIVFHEMSHSIVARRNGLQMKGITLFIFGGVAEMNGEPPSAKAEFKMAVAGPIASVIIGLAFLGVFRMTSNSFSPGITATLEYLGIINLVLAAFNMLPAFPLDGGRVLRSILWHWMKNLRKATRITSRIGSGFGVALAVLGVFFFLQGQLIGGIWWFLIGMFLKGASAMSHKQLLIRQALEGETVERFMNPEPITVSPSLKLQDLVENFVYRHHHKLFPVVQEGSLKGCVVTEDIKEVPRGDWPNKTVADVMKRCSERNTIEAESDAVEALNQMNRSRTSRLMVTRGSALAGVLTMKDLIQFLSLKLDLESDEELEQAAAHS